MAHGALQSLVWDFGQTALSSLQFLKETFANTPTLRIKAVAYPIQRTRGVVHWSSGSITV